MEEQIYISASYYKQKYYINPKFEGLPVEIRNDMQALCVTTAEKLKGIVSLGFYPNGDIFFNVDSEEDDFQFDRIGAELELKEIREENKDQFKKMKLWYLMYHTDYGEIFRRATILYHKENKSSQEITQILMDEYGDHMKETIVETIEIVKN